MYIGDFDVFNQQELFNQIYKAQSTPQDIYGLKGGHTYKRTYISA